MLNGYVVKTPTVSAAGERNSVQHTVPVKRSASCGAVTVDEEHQSLASHQSPAVNQATSAAADCASDPRYTRYMSTIINLFSNSLIVSLVYAHKFINSILNQRCWQSLGGQHGKGVDGLFKNVSFKTAFEGVESG